MTVETIEAPVAAPAAPASAPAQKPIASQATDQATPPAQATPSEVSDWRKSIVEARAKGDEAVATKLAKRLERFSDPGVLFDSLEQTQRELHESGRIKLPGKEATDDERAAFAKALGVPEKPDGYAKAFKLELPDGVTLDENDQAQIKGITEYLHAKGGFAAAPEVVKAAQELYVEMREAAQANLVAAGHQARLETEKALKAEWGNEFKPNLQFTAQGAKALAGNDADELTSIRLENGVLLGDHPMFIKAMMQAGRMAGQDPLLWQASQMGGTPASLQERKTQIMKLAYGNADEQKEYNRLSAPGGELEALITKLDSIRAS